MINNFLPDSYFIPLLSAIFAVDAALTIYLLLHNGQKVNRFFATFIEWWGPEGVLVVKTAAFLFIILFTDNLDIMIQLGLISVWSLIVFWNIYQIRRLFKGKDQ